MRLKRNRYCGEVTISDKDKIVVVAGFVNKLRDLGNLCFIDLRDRSGIVQLALDENSDDKIMELAKSLKSEDVILASGVVKERSSKNKELKTGDIEIYIDDMEISNRAKVTPFEIASQKEVSNDLKLKYRYLDLRRESLQSAIIKRHKITKTTRDFFDKNGFLEIETPILVKSTPEGARDFLVPSRTKKGSFFALPQSPQLYKQMLMVAGFDRYFQIARCFRDEDLRADRQSEFTQIDLEMSFVEADDVMEVNENFMKYLFKEVLDIDLKTPFKRLDYNDAMNDYGSDKPDTRFGIKIKNLSQSLKMSQFKIFAQAAENDGVRGINLKGLADNLSRKNIDKLTEFVKGYNASGLAFTKITKDARVSSYEKFLTDDEIKYIEDELQAQEGDVIFIVADKNKNIALESLGALRCKLAKDFNLIDKDKFEFLWVVNFPLFEYDENEKRLVAKHHPFTSVNDNDIDKLKTNPLECRAKAYDLVLNGCEVGGGSIRINDLNLQNEIFNLIGMKEDEINNKFSYLLDALSYGAPPHGGMAYGLDRLVMLILGKETIRDVIAFPKVQSGAELLTASPSPVDETQLDELSIKLNL